MIDAREDIARLEDEIEALAQSLERARKIGLLAKLSVAAGALWMAGAAAALVPVSPAALLGSIAATLGGIVLAGSNRSTAAQAAVALRDAETRRAALIGTIELRTVSGEPADA